MGEPRAGRRLAFSGDTRPCRGVIEAARGADLLVHEASFISEDAGRAEETGHSTASEAASVATYAGVRMLALTHLGARAHPRAVADEARAVFADTCVPKDFDIIVVPFPERGAPALLRGAARGWEEGGRAAPPEPAGSSDDPAEEAQ